MCREEKLLVRHNKAENSCKINFLKKTEAVTGGVV